MEHKGIKVIARQSHEDYLETILRISKRKQFVRSIDLANDLNYSRPSVTIAVKKLKEDGYIFVNEKNHITLSESGLAIAEKVFYRHEILTQYLIKIGVEPEIAEVDACTIEHVISQETFEAIERELNKDER